MDKNTLGHVYFDAKENYSETKVESIDRAKIRNAPLTTLINEYKLKDIVNEIKLYEKLTDVYDNANYSDSFYAQSSNRQEKRKASEITDGDVREDEDLESITVEKDVQKEQELAHCNLIKPKKCSVICLQTIDDLKETCKSLNLKFSESDGKDYEVDMIIDDTISHEGENYYLVKWKNYESKHNTWEPESHLLGCKDMISYYRAIKKRQSTKLTKDLLRFFVREITTRRPCDILSLTKLCALITKTAEKDVTGLQLNIKKIKAKAREILDLKFSKIQKFSEGLLNLMIFSEARKQVLVNLKEWERNINQCNPSAYIEVENNVDLETAPTEFQFIHDYIKPPGVYMAAEPVTFCDCENCYECRHSCCPGDNDGHFAYSKCGRLVLEPGYPIYECNKRCKCGIDCVNRVVQHGQKIKVAIFRTSNGCGWGLKTLETIRQGMFVLEYLGEIITSDEAESRGAIYDYLGRSYLFDLDYGLENCAYTVDAGHVGNAAHFMNHSCDPNLHVYAVWINEPDPLLPRLAFFAKKKIMRGEELTFDYKMVKNHDRFDPSSPTPDHQRIPCRCNSQKCRKYLF